MRTARDAHRLFYGLLPSRAAGAEPLAFLKANAGRIKTHHLKDWSPDPQKHHRVLLGEGLGRWKELLEVAETVDGWSMNSSNRRAAASHRLKPPGAP